MARSHTPDNKTFQPLTPCERDLLIARTTAAVKEYMSQPHFDASHDFSHVQRVLALADHILEVEHKTKPHTSFDSTIVKITALLHDIGDRKYPAPLDSSESTHKKKPLAERMMLDLDYPPALTAMTQIIITCVSFSTERSDPQLVQDTLRKHPELAIVQDADRLDALGAVGIARAFAYGGAKQKHRGLDGTMLHLDEKLLKLEDMMKTQEGKRLARIRMKRLQKFKEWWEDEITRSDATAPNACIS